MMQDCKTPVEKLAKEERDTLLSWLDSCNFVLVAKMIGVDWRTLLKAAHGEKVHRATAMCIRTKLQERNNASA